MSPILSRWLIFALWISFPLMSALGDVGGEDGPSASFTNHGRHFPESRNDPKFDISLDRIAFPLNSWQGRFRIVRVRIFNDTKTSFTFSSEKDAVQAHIGKDRVVSAHLIPSAVAPELWDKLDKSAREKLVYPKTLPPDSVRYVYLFFPADKLTDMPAGFSWNIASLKKSVDITPPPATAP